MIQNLSIVEEAVAVVDATRWATHRVPVLELIDQSIEHNSSGVADVFSLVVHESVETLSENGSLYEELLQSALSVRLVVLLSTEGKQTISVDSKVEFPDVFRIHHERVRVIVIENERGILFVPGTLTPQAVAVQGHQSVDVSAKQLIEDVLVNPEVFSALFSSTKDSPYQLFSVGTRQVWFGSVPSSAISGALTEVGQELVGGDGFSALKRKPVDWVIPPALTGELREMDILVAGGKSDQGYRDVHKQSDATRRAFGIGRRRSWMNRLAEFPGLQISECTKMATLLEECEGRFIQLNSEVEASDGFDSDEHVLFEKSGIRLQREDSSRESLRNSVRDLLEGVLNGVVSGLRDGQSLSPYFDRLDQSIERVQPRTKEEIADLLQAEGLSQELAKLRSAQATVPKGLLVKLGALLARIALKMVWRVLFMAVLVICVFLTIDDIANWDGLSSVIAPDSPLLRIAEVVLTVQLLMMGFAAFVWSYTDSAIHRWGERIGLKAIDRRIDTHKELIEQIALNDWVLSKLRRSSAEPLIKFRQCLEDLSNGLKRVLIDPTLRSELSDIDVTYNPAIRETLTAGAQVGIFRNLPLVQKLLRADVVRILQTSIESHGYALLGGNSGDVSSRILREVEAPLIKYTNSMMKYGVYSSYHVVDKEEGHSLRQQLVDEYWSDNEVVAGMLGDVVLADRDSPMVHFVLPETLSQLDGDPEGHRLVRFAPRPSQLDGVFRGASDQRKVAEVVFTRSASIGGVLRLVGFRDGLMA